MFVEFSDTLVNSNQILCIFKHDEGDKKLIFIKFIDPDYKVLAESFETERERDLRYNNIKSYFKHIHKNSV